MPKPYRMSPRTGTVVDLERPKLFVYDEETREIRVIVRHDLPYSPVTHEVTRLVRERDPWPTRDERESVQERVNNDPLHQLLPGVPYADLPRWSLEYESLGNGRQRVFWMSTEPIPSALVSPSGGFAITVPRQAYVGTVVRESGEWYVRDAANVTSPDEPFKDASAARRWLKRNAKPTGVPKTVLNHGKPKVVAEVVHNIHKDGWDS